MEITAFHEFGHHLFHSPVLSLFGTPNKSKWEWQAHVIAACALIPREVIRSREFNAIGEEFNLPRDLILFRARVYQQLHL